MELNIEKIEECVKHYVAEMSESSEQYNENGYYEYTDAIVDITYSAGYAFSDLWEDNGESSKLQSIIDKMLYRISVDMNKYYLFD